MSVICTYNSQSWPGGHWGMHTLNHGLPEGHVSHTLFTCILIRFIDIAV